MGPRKDGKDVGLCLVLVMGLLVGLRRSSVRDLNVVQVKGQELDLLGVALRYQMMRQDVMDVDLLLVPMMGLMQDKVMVSMKPEPVDLKVVWCVIQVPSESVGSVRPWQS